MVGKYKVILFYSRYNWESQRTRMSLRKFLEEQWRNHKYYLTEVDYEVERESIREYAVTGIPTVLIYRDDLLVCKRVGEISYHEFEKLFNQILEDQNETE